MATKEELASKLAGELAKLFSDEVYGAEGCPLDADIDEIEDNAVLAAKAAFDAVIARALELQNQKLPNKEMTSSSSRYISMPPRKTTSY